MKKYWNELSAAEKCYVVVSFGWACAFVFFIYAHVRLALGP